MSDKSQDPTPSLWKRLRSRRSTRWAIDIALVLAVVAAITAYQTRHLLTGDDPLPPATVQALDGSERDLSQLDADRTLIYFWTTWCGVCDLQNGAVQSLHKRADGESLEVMAIALHYEHPDEITNYIEKEELHFPVYLGTPGLAERFNIQSFPTIYIIDDQQQIRHGLVGYTTGIGLRARLWW